MKKNTSLPLAVLLAAGLSSLGAKRSCSCHFGTARISSATLTDKVDSSKVEAIGHKDAFNESVEKIFYVVTYKNCPKNTNITATWKYLGGPDGSPKPQVIDRPIKKTVTGSGRIAFSLSRPARGFPPGKYEVIVELGGRQVRSQTFSVKATAGGRGTPAPASSSNAPSARAPRQAPAARP